MKKSTFLRKLLSAVCCLAMLVTMLPIVPAAAADDTLLIAANPNAGTSISGGSLSSFSDAAEITYTKAAEVTAGLGLFAGAGGKFMPKSNLTRAQMATIIVKMLNGADANADAFKGSGKFSDTAIFEGGWAEGYINWCATLGIVSGYGDGTFKPGNNVTAAEAATMILNALKVDAGAGTWPHTVMAKAEELDMFDDFLAKPANDKALTREELAVMALVGLEYSPDGKQGYEYNGVIYDSYMDAYMVAGSANVGKINPTQGDSLAGKVFELKTAEGFITGNQGTGLEYTELNDTTAFAIESGLDSIGHYVTVYYKELYTTDDEPGLTYTIYDETTVVKVDEAATTAKEYKALFGKSYDPAAKVALFDGGYVLTDSDGALSSTDYTKGSAAKEGTYFIYEGKIVAYMDPVTVYAGQITMVDTMEGYESIMIGAESISNTEGDDNVVEYTGIAAKDYVTYVVAQGLYVLSPVSTVTGTVAKITTNDNGEQVITVNGTQYVQFTGDNTAGIAKIIADTTSFDFTATYNVHLTADNHFLFLEKHEGALDIASTVYLLGQRTIQTKDSYGKTIDTTYGRGVDMNGNEVMIPVQVEYQDGTVLPVGGASVTKAGYYCVQDYSDKDCKEAGVKKLTAFGSTYDEEKSPIFTATYGSSANDMIFAGGGTYSCGYAHGQSSTRYVVLEGSADQSTPLEATAKTGSISVSLDREGNTANPVALISKNADGVNMLEAVVIVSDLSTATELKSIYIDANKTASSGKTTDGYVFDAYNAENGEEMSIVLSTETLPEGVAGGFYRVSVDEDGLYTFHKTGADGDYKVASVDGDAGTTAGRKDGIDRANVIYGYILTSVYNNKIYSFPVADNPGVGSTKVIDTRSEDQIKIDRLPQITSVTQLAALKTTRTDKIVCLDAYVNTQGTDTIKTFFVTKVIDAEKTYGHGSVLYAAEPLAASSEQTFYVVESADLKPGAVVTVEDMSTVTKNTMNGTAAATSSGFYEFIYDIEADSYSMLLLRANYGGSSTTGLGSWGYTQGLHKDITDIEGDVVTVEAAHANEAAVGCNGSGMAPLTLTLDNSTFVLDLRDDFSEVAKITSVAELKARYITADLTIDYFQPDGLSLTSAAPASCTPSAIFITAAEKLPAPRTIEEIAVLLDETVLSGIADGAQIIDMTDSGLDSKADLADALANGQYQVKVAEYEGALYVVSCVLVPKSIPAGALVHSTGGVLNTDTSGWFIVMDNAGDTSLVPGNQYYFEYDNTYMADMPRTYDARFLYATVENAPSASNAYGVTAKVGGSTKYWHTDGWGAASGTMHGGCFSYHRWVKGLTANPDGTYSMTLAQAHGNSANCTTSGVTCYAGNTQTALTLSASTLIVDTRAPEGGALTLAEFAAVYNKNGAGSVFVNSYFADGSTDNTPEYVVILPETDMAAWGADVLLLEDFESSSGVPAGVLASSTGSPSVDKKEIKTEANGNQYLQVSIANKSGTVANTKLVTVNTFGTEYMVEYDYMFGSDAYYTTQTRFNGTKRPDKKGTDPVVMQIRKSGTVYAYFTGESSEANGYSSEYIETNDNYYQLKLKKYGDESKTVFTFEKDTWYTIRQTISGSAKTAKFQVYDRDTGALLAERTLPNCTIGAGTVSIEIYGVQTKTDTSTTITGIDNIKITDLSN